MDIDEGVETVIYVEKDDKDNYQISVANSESQKSQPVNANKTTTVQVETCSKSKQKSAFTMDAYLPKYSAAIQMLLKSGEIHKEWEKFIEETAYHVLSVGEFETRGVYQDFGRYMHMKYPCIAHKAMKEPWVCYSLW